MLVNVDNINRMIEAISAQAEPIAMGTWLSHNTECGTTACLAGWANILRHEVQGKLDLEAGPIDGRWIDLTDTVAAAQWMGLVDEDGAAQTSLFFKSGVDQLLPADRKTAAIALLTKLRDEGKAEWTDFVKYDPDSGYYALKI